MPPGYPPAYAGSGLLLLHRAFYGARRAFPVRWFEVAHKATGLHPDWFTWPTSQRVTQTQLPPACDGFLYVVRAGDTLFNLAQRFGVSLDDLIRANPQLTDPSRLQVGQTICIPRQPGPPECPNGILYQIRAGDTLFALAQRFGVTVAEILAANPLITDPNQLRVGQIICIPRPAPAVPFCVLLLTPATGVTGTGVLVANISAGQVGVALFGVPDPGTLPGGFTRYAVVIEGPPGTVRRFNLVRVAEGIWVGAQDYATALPSGGTVRVVPTTDTVDGNALFTGSLTDCRGVVLT